MLLSGGGRTDKELHCLKVQRKDSSILTQQFPHGYIQIDIRSRRYAIRIKGDELRSGSIIGADIYAEGWEAAQKRVKAALQAIYTDLLDDKFFISMTDGFSKILNGIHDFIDGIGGIYPLLMGLSSFILSSIAGKI